MILLFSDFGPTGPYTGLMKAVLARAAPGVPIIDLFCDAPVFDPQISAYLLAAYAEGFYPGDVFLCVVDPEVGTPRRPLVMYASGRWFVGPDNGLFEIVRRRAHECYAWTIEWRPAHLSATFHGRDLFAPVAARLARGEAAPGVSIPLEAISRPVWPDDLARILYIDGYGNAMTGIRASTLPANAIIEVGNHHLQRGRTFADVAPGAALWYENSNGLAEIAVNQGRADRTFALRIGSPVTVITTP
jgi:S-adenosylmethionine hydrolase